MGPRSIPLWLPLPEYAGLMAHDVRASYDAGLATRPIGETARDTLAWLRDHPDAAVTGLTRDEEAEVLRAWHARADAIVHDEWHRPGPERDAYRRGLSPKPQPNRSIALTTVS